MEGNGVVEDDKMVGGMKEYREGLELPGNGAGEDE